jgi:hypothetical protein
VSEPEPKRCIFCAKPVSIIESKTNTQVQQAFSGFRDGVVVKRPAKVIYWHNVCDMPEDDDG